MTKAWMVRAGRNARFIEDFRNRSMIGIGWFAIGDLANLTTKAEILEKVRIAYPAYSDQAAMMAASQLSRFKSEFKIGDRVVSYDPRLRRYLCGEIASGYKFVADVAEEEFLNQRSVVWLHEKPRDEISQSARNSLGSISTIFLIQDDVASELWSSTLSKNGEPAYGSDEKTDGVIDFEQLAMETIKDRVAALDWLQMQELVAGLLRAMGYKTNVSAPGSDRGKDIIASPDGFGFQEPRIVVEVKHRKGEKMGSQEIRAFLGGRHARDKGLFVSSGGFSKEAYYEAERSNISITLMDFEDLVQAVIDHYPRFDQETRQILPLRTVYWPIQ